MKRSSLPRWWLLALLPTLSTIVHHLWLGALSPGAFLLQTLPSPLLLIAVAVLHRGRTPFSLRVSKELRLLSVGLVGTLGVVALQRLGSDGSWHVFAQPRSVVQVLSIAPALMGGLMAAVGFVLTAFRSVGGEYSAGAVTTWAMQPRARATLLWFKLGVLAAVLGVELFQVLVGPFLVRFDALLCATAVLAWVVAPIGMLRTQRAWEGVQVVVLCGVAGGALTALCLEPGVLSLALFGAFAGVLLRVAFALGRRADLSPSPPPVASLRWLAPALRLGSPVLRKELMIHRVTLVTSLGMVGVWDQGLSLHRGGVVEDQVPIFLVSVVAVVLAFVCGVETFAEERALDTAVWEEANSPRRRLLWTKLSTSFGIMLMISLALPALMITVQPGWSVVDSTLHTGPVGVAAVAGLILGVWALSVLGGAPRPGKVEAAMVRVGVLLVAALVLVGGAMLGGSALAGLAAHGASTVGPSAVERWAGLALESTPGAVVFVGALWAARAAWLRGRFDRRTVLAAAAVAVAVLGQSFLSARWTSAAPQRTAAHAADSSLSLKSLASADRGGR